MVYIVYGDIYHMYTHSFHARLYVMCAPYMTHVTCLMHVTHRIFVMYAIIEMKILHIMRKMNAGSLNTVMFMMNVMYMMDV